MILPSPVPLCNTPDALSQQGVPTARRMLLKGLFLAVLLAPLPAHAQLAGGGLPDAIKNDDEAEVYTQLVAGKNANGRDANDTPMLVLAASLDRVRIGQLLLQRGARTTEKDAKGETALTMAIRKGNRDFARMLLDRGADPNLAGPNGESPLMTAIVSGDAAIVEALVNAKADVDAGDYTGHTPLGEAQRRGERHIVEILRKAGASE
jgi:uncharacterized protein